MGYTRYSCLYQGTAANNLRWCGVNVTVCVTPLLWLRGIFICVLQWICMYIHTYIIYVYAILSICNSQYNVVHFIECYTLFGSGVTLPYMFLKQCVL